MTRLITDWICDMENSAAEWDRELKKLTGAGYIEIGSMVSGWSAESISDTCGKGYYRKRYCSK